MEITPLIEYTDNQLENFCDEKKPIRECHDCRKKILTIIDNYKLVITLLTEKEGLNTK